MVGGRPICAAGWDDMDAKIVCSKELGFGGSTKGIATNNGYFGAKSTNFIISEVACESANQKLRDCPHQTRNVCPSGGIAGVVCVDPEQLTLVNQNQAKNQGNVLLHGKYPVCSSNWDEKDAQVVCNSLYGKMFEDRNSQVPVFKATVNSDFGQAPSNHFIMSNVQCKGNEKFLTDCNANYFPLAKDRNRCQNAAGVQCAKCTVTDLKNIIQMIKENVDFRETKQSVRDAFEKLKKDCHPWECVPGKKQEYPEYCLTYQFLQSFANIVKEDRKKSTGPAQKLRLLSLKFDMSEQIRYLKDDSDAQKIQSSIGNLQEQTGAFQTQLGDYFIRMAKYNEAKNVADFKCARTIWTRQKQQISGILDSMVPQVKKLFEVAFVSAGLNVADKAAALALAIKSGFRPASAALNPGEFADVLKNIQEALGAVGDATASLKGVQYTFAKTIPKFYTLMAELQENFRNNTEMSKEMYRILKIDDVSKFTVDDANKFLYYYNEFTPSITVEQLARFKSLVTEMIDSACDVILKEGSGVGAAMVRMLFVSLCPEIKRDRDILIDLVEAVKESEVDLNGNVYAALAKSKLAISEAQNYKKVMGLSTMTTIRNAIAGKRGYVLYQIQKLDVINGACDLVKYRNDGVEESYCQQLRANPNGQLGDLLSGLAGSNKDMCPHTKAVTVNIPGRFRRGDEKIPDGTLDLSVLFDAKVADPSVSFQIPNKQWLVNNGWLEGSDANKGPFYLKKFELFLPPWYGKDTKEVHTELALVKNTLEPGGDLYNFDDDVHYIFKYTDHQPECSNKVGNPYNTDCKEKGPKPCIRTAGVKYLQKVYPSLMSLWNLHLSLPQAVRKQGVIPYSPSGEFNLKARVEICFKGAKSGKRDVEETEKRWAIECCAEKDPPQAISSGFKCRNCPSGSEPRLVGYYCESCPAGYEPRKKEDFEFAKGVFGCQPCQPKFFKASVGNSQCQPCPTTSKDQIGATQCLT